MASTDPPNPRNSSGSGPDAPQPRAPAGGSSGGRADSGGAGGDVAIDDQTRVTGSGGRIAMGGDRALIQSLIEGYELEEEIHRGGQGVVYRAMQLGTKQRVALKVLLEGPFAGDAARRRFEREVELAASLRHPSIVTILDSGISHGRYYFAMELIEGPRLDVYLRERHPGLDQTLALFAEICDAVNFAHQRGVIHRDLKPGNILVVEDHSAGPPSDSLWRRRRALPVSASQTIGRARPKILDFGLAKSNRLADPNQTMTMAGVSTAGQVIGTLAYMSPEQASGQPDVDVRSDVYSLGVIFYESLLGRAPYGVTGPLADVLRRISHDDPLRPRSLRDTSRFGRLIDDELETILLKCLEKDPARRYQTAGDLAGDLRRYLAGDPIEAKRASGLYMFRKTLRRYRLQAAIAGAALLTLIIFVAVFATLYTREAATRARVADLLDLADERTRAAQAAESAERDARREADVARRAALAAADELRGALVRDKVQRGNVALAQHDLAEARDGYWDAYDDRADNPAALWALRQYYIQSGDQGAQLLFLNRSGPLALAPSGRVAAVCETPRGVTLRQVEGGRTLGWFAAPDDLVTLSVTDDGDVIAAGWYWARWWRPGSAQALASISFKELREPHAVFLLPGGGDLGAPPRIGVIDATGITLYDTSNGAIAGAASLSSPPLAPPAVSIARRQVAIATTAGIELFTIDRSGGVQREVFWSRGVHSSPRLVAFSADDHLLLHLPGESVEAAALDGDGRGAWFSLLATSDTWSHLAVRDVHGALALGQRSGTVAFFEGGRQRDTWRVTSRSLDALSLDEDGQTIVTVDERGAATRWRRSSAADGVRQIGDRSPLAWSASADGASVLICDATGTLIRYHRHGGEATVNVRRNALNRRAIDSAAQGGVGVSQSGDGSVRALRYLNRVLLESGTRSDGRTLNWTHPVAPLLRHAALSADGRILALAAQSVAGDRQLIWFADAQSWLAAPTLRRNMPPAAVPIDVSGAAIRSITFVPGTKDLLVARSNGALLLVSPEAQTEYTAAQLRGPGAATPPPWTTLESPPTTLAFDREGQRLAVACEDGVVRLIAYLDGAEESRLFIGGTVDTLAFNARGDVLLVGEREGAVSLFDLRSLDRITSWTFRNLGATPLAAWVGEDDTLLLSYDDRIHERQYATADGAIQRNWGFGVQRQAQRALQDNRLPLAWTAAARLCGVSDELTRTTRMAVLTYALRRPGAFVDPSWIEEATEEAPATDLLRLGHAAYEGDRFALASRLLSAAADQVDGRIDAYSAWRLAECAYLLGDLSSAVQQLAAVAERQDFDARNLPRLNLERIAALLWLGRRGEAEAELGRIDPERAGDRSSVTDLMATIVIGNYLLGREGDSQVAATFQRLLSIFPERWLTYTDDLEFFAAEAARRAGDLSRARERYQRCIDQARDGWPANWARFRLEQLSRTTPPATPVVPAPDAGAPPESPRFPNRPGEAIIPK